MMKVYVCSPYRAGDSAELDRNIEYAQALTRQALKAGLAPITPHLYMTQCLDERKPQERAQGLAAGLELLKGCDFMIVGDKYGISEGMYREIETAKALRIPVINDAGLLVRAKHEKQRAEGREAGRRIRQEVCVLLLQREKLTYLQWVQLQRAVPESLRLCNEQSSRRLHGGKN